MSMNVSLGPLEEFVREKVAQGEYGNESEVVSEAVRLLKAREERWKAEARVKIEEGLASCREGNLIPGDQVFAEIYTWLDELDKAPPQA
jgi:putative addiction module CopG family antidote